MQLGCYGSLDQAQALKDAGFEFLEADAQPLLQSGVPSSQWVGQAPDPAGLALPIVAARGWLAEDQPILGPQHDPIALQNTMQRVANRAQHLGVRCLIFDPPTAIRSLEGVDGPTVQGQLGDFIRMGCAMCAHHGVSLLIEPIDDTASYPLGTITQAIHMCDRVQHRCLGVVVDTGVFRRLADRDQPLLSLGDRLGYARVSSPQGAPTEGTDDLSDIEDFFCMLRKAGYDGPIGVEPDWRETGVPHEAAMAWAQRLRRAWDQAGRCEDTPQNGLR